MVVIKLNCSHSRVVILKVYPAQRIPRAQLGVSVGISVTVAQGLSLGIGGGYTMAALDRIDAQEAAQEELNALVARNDPNEAAQRVYVTGSVVGLGVGVCGGGECR